MPQDGPKIVPRALWAALGRSWAALELLLAALRPFLAALGRLLGRSWAVLGPLLGALGGLFGARGRSWEPPGRFRLDFLPPEGRFFVRLGKHFRPSEDRLGCELETGCE